MKDNSFYGLIGLFLLMFSIKEILNQCEVQHCKQCESNNNTLCTTCDDGYWIDNNRCEQCPTNCLTCDSNQNCTKCINTNFELINGTCKCKLNNCLKCSENATNICDECINANYNKTNGTCICKESHCLTCNETGSSCSQCENNFKLNNGKCICEVDKCVKCSSTEKCKECDVNFEFINGSCICNVSHCAECSNEKDKCKTCNANFIMKNSTCPCYDRNCLECASPLYGTCKKCKYNFTLTNEGTCINKSISNCLYYNDKSCDYCEFGYSLENGTCNNKSINCTDVNCKECYDQNGTETCFDCKDGYTLENGKCTKNPECDLFVNNICVHCPENYFNVNSTCFLKCKGADCNKDKTNYTCLKCEKNSLVEIPNCNSTEYCNVTNCAMCIKKNECIRCDVGYGLYNKQCVECPDFCLHCDYDKKCKSCIKGYTLVNGTCFETFNIIE